MKSNEELTMELLAKVAPDISLLISYIAHFKIKPDFLTDVINQVYKIAVGTGSGKVSIVIEDSRIRSVHGVENRIVDKDVFI
jgi:hypothetical protein